jgi:amino acid permease
MGYNVFIWVHLSIWNSSPAKYISCLSFLGLAYLTLVLCMQFPSRLPLDSSGLAEWKWDGLSIATAISLCTVAFVTPTNVATLQSDLANPIRRRIKKVNLLVIVIQQVLYSLLAILGYLSTLEGTPVLITDLNPPLNAKSDRLMDAGKCVMFLALVCDVPTYILPSRKALLQLFNARETQKTEMISGALCLGLPTLVMLTHLDPNLLMNVLAAQCAWFFYLVPGIVELTMSSQPWYAPKNLFWLCTMLGYTGVSMWALLGSL